MHFETVAHNVLSLFDSLLNESNVGVIATLTAFNLTILQEI